MRHLEVLKLAVNYIITVDGVKTLSESISSCDYYIKNEDVILLKEDRASREALLKSLNVDRVIVSSLGVTEDTTLYKKDSISFIKVGDKKWI